jgi:hypothetical protein
MGSADVKATNADVARIARIVCQQRQRGMLRHQIRQVVFDLRQVGRCAQFVRECHEAALGLAEYTWEYRAPSAAMMECKLKAAGLAVAIPEPGDIVAVNGGVPPERWDDWAWQKAEGRYGHIAIFLGEGSMAENTSSRQRGPGHVISPRAAVQDRITGYYRALPSPADEVAVFLLPGRKAVECHARVEDGVTRVELRPFVEALGYSVRYQDGELLVDRCGL